MTDVALDISNRIEVYATNIGDDELKEDIHFTATSFVRLSENECISICDNIYLKGNTLLTELSTYGVNTALLSNFQDLIIKYTSNISRSQSEINIGKLATTEINQLITANLKLMEKMDLIVKMVKSTAPEFVKGYFESRNTGAAAHRPFSLRFFVMDNKMKPISMVLVSNDELKLRRRTGESGIIQFKNLKEGSYEFTFSKTGYSTVKINANITPRERTDNRVIMLME